MTDAQKRTPPVDILEIATRRLDEAHERSDLVPPSELVRAIDRYTEAVRDWNRAAGLMADLREAQRDGWP